MYHQSRIVVFFNLKCLLSFYRNKKKLDGYLNLNLFTFLNLLQQIDNTGWLFQKTKLNFVFEMYLKTICY